MLPDWGLLPDHAVQLIKRREWDNSASLKARLLGDKPFPIRLGLKQPRGKAAVSNMGHFLNFVEAWKNFPYQEMVRWESKRYRTLSEQRIPTFLIVDSISQLARVIGKQAAGRCKLWERNMAPILGFDGSDRFSGVLYPVLVRHLETIEKISRRDSELLSRLLPQLGQGMGNGCYLRALPVTGVDTKFIETHLPLIEDLMDALHDGGVSSAGGLMEWLDCKSNPRGWLVLRPLCERTRKSLGALPILRIPGEVLAGHELVADNILVVENIQSGLALPEMESTIAVAGGGNNVSWMDAQWLSRKRIGYWGDIDTWGFSILSDAREKVSGLTALMMDRDTVLAHEERMDVEPTPVPTLPRFLTDDEITLFEDLNAGKFKSNRLEQERISSDYIRQQLENWLSPDDIAQDPGTTLLSKEQKLELNDRLEAHYSTPGMEPSEI